MHLLVDPVVLYFCEDLPPSITPADYYDYIIKWQKFIKNPKNKFQISTGCRSALYYANCFLDPRRLVSYFRGIPGIASLPIDKLPRICNGIIERSYNWTPFGEEMFVPSFDCITLTPDLSKRIPNETIAESLEKTLGYIVWARLIANNIIPDNLYLFTHPIPGYNKIQIDVCLSGEKFVSCIPIKIP